VGVSANRAAQACPNAADVPIWVMYDRLQAGNMSSIRKVASCLSLLAVLFTAVIPGASLIFLFAVVPILLFVCYAALAPKFQAANHYALPSSPFLFVIAPRAPPIA
jgi:hypothetical protein